MRNKVGDMVFWVPVLLLVGFLLVTPWFGSASGMAGEGPGVPPTSLAKHIHSGAAASDANLDGPGPAPEIPTPKPQPGA